MKAVAFVLSMFALGAVSAHLFGCVKPPTAKQAGAVAEASCTLLQAFAQSPEEEALCATADELIGLAQDVRAKRAAAWADGGVVGLTRKAGKCQIVHDVCATDEELSAVIKAKKVKQ